MGQFFGGGGQLGFDVFEHNVERVAVKCGN
jgi:hypothetical protein